MYAVVVNYHEILKEFVVLDSALHWARENSKKYGVLAVKDMEYKKKGRIRAFGLVGRLSWAVECGQCKGDGCSSCYMWGALEERI